jgi:hypothetical protein
MIGFEGRLQWRLALTIQASCQAISMRKVKYLQTFIYLVGPAESPDHAS